MSPTIIPTTMPPPVPRPHALAFFSGVDGTGPTPMPPPMPPPPQFAMQQQQPATSSGSWHGAAAPLSDNADGDEKKTVNCPYCGGRAINLGGSKRDTKYTYACEEPACDSLVKRAS